MSLSALLDQIRLRPDQVRFGDVMDAIATHYDYTPTRFRNGELTNQAGQNEGSCKLFAFAQLHGLSKDETLACFGDYYRIEVLGEPDGSNHGNIRNFITTGWDGIAFDVAPLSAKPV